jgi:phosphonate transport system substrate-binding protein
MKRRSLYIVLAMVMVFSMVLAACQAKATPTEEPVVEPTAVPATAVPEGPKVGSAERPIKVLFVPSTEVEKIVAGGDLLAATLKETTGYEFVVSVPTSYAATIEEMCASPEDTMGFIPGLGYVLANQLCGVDVSLKAQRYGWDVYWAQVVVLRDSGIDSLDDLNGLKWAYPDPGSTSGYLAALPLFEEAGVVAGEELQAGGHPQVIRAVYNGEADFGTTFFSAPGKPEGEPKWAVGDAPDIPDELLESCAPTEDGKNIKCGDWTVLDARRNLAGELPDVVQKVKILTLSPAIPNDTLSFGPDFPEDVRQAIVDALLAFATNNPDGFKEAMAAYSWNGLSLAVDSEYDVVRTMVSAAGITLESLGQ